MTNTPSPTDEDRELIERLPYIASVLQANAHKFTVPDHIPAKVACIRKAAARLESLLSDRDELEEALKKISIGEVGGSDPFESYMLLRKLALDALNRSTDRAT